MFDRLYRKGYHVAYCVLGDKQAAEDAAQEALARTYVHWSRASANAEGWVARVAANQAIAIIRRKRRRLPFMASPITTSPETRSWINSPLDRSGGRGTTTGGAFDHLRSTRAIRWRRAASCSWISSIRFFFAQYSILGPVGIFRR